MTSILAVINFNRKIFLKCLVFFIFLILLCPSISGLKIAPANANTEVVKNPSASLESIDPELVDILPNTDNKELQTALDISEVQSSRYPYNYSDVMVIYNEDSPISVQIAQYFQQTRNIPDINMCNISTSTGEVINRATFEEVRTQVENYLQDNNLTSKINFWCLKSYGLVM